MKIITKKNSEFLVVNPEVEPTAVEIFGPPGFAGIVRYPLANGVDFVWVHNSSKNGGEWVSWRLEDVYLKKSYSTNLSAIADLMNHFQSLSSIELKSLKEEVQKEEKTQLEKDIAVLKEELERIKSIQKEVNQLSKKVIDKAKEI
jgi:hypothetical protein